MWPAIRSANIPRLPPPACSRSPTRRGCCASAATPCRRRCRSGEGAMAAIIGLEQSRMSKPPARRRQQARSARSPTTMAAGSWSFQAQRPAVEQAAAALHRQGRQAGDHAAGFRAVPFGADGAGRRSHARGAGQRSPKTRPVVPVVANVVVAAAERSGRDRRAPCRAGDRPGALARDGRVVRRERRDHAL